MGAVQQLWTGVPQAASPATYNVNNQLTNWKGTNLTYDANGNLTNDGTNTYTWNARNQLAAISGGVAASFQYDPFGRRVSKTIGGITQYLYDGANPVQEISGTTASANLLTGGVDEYFQRTDPAGARSFLTDALGSTLALADSTGTLQTTYTFEPFGNTSVTGTATTNSFAYTGRELDATGLYFYRARYYNPQSQRFISEDPIEFGGGDVNLYGYLGQDPADDIDPLGLFGLDDFLNGLSDAIAGAGDSLTFGGTAAVRRLLNSGCDPANTSGTAYKVGEGIEVAAEIGLTLGSSALKQAAKEASRAVVRREARRLTADIVRGEGEVLHHVNPLFGHPGNIPTLFPTGGLPAALHSGPLNVALVDAAEHAGIHRATRALEQIGVSIVNPGTTTGRIIGNLIGRKSGCD